MNPQPTCMSCKYWVRDHDYTHDGWCDRYKMHSYVCETCKKHEQLKNEPIEPIEPIDKP